MAQEGERDQSMAREGEHSQSMAQEREYHQSPIRRVRILERESRLAMTQESIHAPRVRVHNHALGLSMNPIARLGELMPYCLLPREG